MKSIVTALALSALLLSSSAQAGSVVLLPQPVQVGDETGRYRQGVPISVLERDKGAISIVPAPMDHGSFAFDVVIYNDGDAPANFDTSNIKAEIGKETLAPLTADELASAAKSRAMWSQIGVALLAGAAAAAVANAHTTDTYRGRLRTPHGTYSWVSTYRDNSLGQVAAAGSVVAGVAGVASIQKRLDDTLDMIGGNVVQRTTVDPANSYGGRVVIRKPKAGGQQDIKLLIDWNGEQYAFAYHMPKKGEPLPPSLKAATGPGRMARMAAGDSIQPAAAEAPPANTPPAVIPAVAIIEPVATDAMYSRDGAREAEYGRLRKTGLSDGLARATVDRRYGATGTAVR